MSELENKFSDFQQSECKDLELDTSEDQGEKACPTCTPNPNFVLPAEWWEIKEAYLNEAECEYHVRVYPLEIKSPVPSAEGFENVNRSVFTGRSLTDFQTKLILRDALIKILKDLKKPYDVSTIDALETACFIKDGPFINLDSRFIGPAFLIACPAFSIDNIKEDEVEEDQNESGIDTALEVIVNAATLTRNIRQTRMTLHLYHQYYRLAQQVDREGFVIRQQSDMVQRISYEEPRRKLRELKDELNVYLKKNEYAKLHHTGIFTAKRAKTLKFVFKDNDKDYDLEDVYVLADNGCSEYEPLKVSDSSILKSPTMRIVYHFMSRLEQMVSEFQAKEPKPWAEWTLDHWYPTMILENKSDLNLEETETGLSCLIEGQLGIGPELVDSLAKEILSGFKAIEREGNKEACRSLEEKAGKSATSLAENKSGSDSSPQEQRAKAMRKRYSEEYKNQFLQYVKDLVSRDVEEGGVEQEIVTSKLNLNNVFNEVLNYDFNFAPKPFKVEGKLDSGTFNSYQITDIKKLEEKSKEYSKFKFNALEGAKGLSGFSNQIQNSPHFQDAKDALKEAKKFPENGIIDLFKKDNSFDEIIEAMRLCGTGKLGKKALQCILGNVSISDFYDAMLDKTFEFMKINTLDLFLTNIPAGLRIDLDEAIKKEFGGDANLIDLISIKKVNEGEAKLSDITKTKETAKQIYKIIQKSATENNNLDYRKLNEEEKAFLLNNWETESPAAIAKIYSLENEDNTADDKKRKKSESLKLIKTGVREHKKTRDDKVFNRVFSFNKKQSSNVEDLSEFELAAQKFEETAVGKKVDVVFDLIFDFAIDWILEEFSVDELIEDLRQYPIIDFIGDQILNSLTCPATPIFYPPPGDFMKGLSLDPCDQTKGLEIPKIVWPNIDPLNNFKVQWTEIIREKVIEIAGSIIERIVRRLVNTIEGSLCSILGIGVNALADFARDRESVKNTFLDALNEAFCNGAENPETSRARAEELAEALFTPMLIQEGANYEGSAGKIVNVIASVAGTEEFLEALVARDGQENDQFGRRISNAVNTLTPELSALLGSPNQVALFFNTLGSFLPSDDRERIRDLLDSGIPNLPISQAICLTDDQLEDWNDLRKELLRDYPNPQEIVDDLNERTLSTAEDIMDIIGQLDSGPFVGPIIDEINKDACNPNNILNDVSQSDFEKELESEQIDADYANLSRIMQFSFMRGNGLLGHALRDKEGESEFRRKFYKFFFPGYTNSSAEWETKYASKGAFGKFLMNNYNDGNPRGNYPQTVGIKQRDDLIDGQILYDFDKVMTSEFSSRNVVFAYKDTQDLFEYKLHVAASLQMPLKTDFNYNVQVLEKTEEDASFIREMSFETPVEMSKSENDYLKSFGFQFEDNDDSDIRKEAFNSIVRGKLPIDRNYSQLFDKTYETFTQNLVEALLRDYREDDRIPPGYKFGYKSNTLEKGSFVYYNPNTTTPYNLDEEEGILGEFADTRIQALDPASYGGRYSRPKYYIEPRQHQGWVELAAKAFESEDGCDPKTPPLLDMTDIKNREKNLSSTLRNDPRLARDPECINDVPFKALINAKMQAKMDGVVRATLRTYLAEFFMKGYGLFSNLQVRLNNFDQSLPLYITNQMKKEMVDLGSSFANRKIRIVKERYWYTFLEQCVEAYVRMRDYDGVEPPPPIAEALERIELGIDNYQNVTRSMRKKIRKNLPNSIRKPNKNYDPIIESSKSPQNMVLMAIAYRISPDRENFFDGGEVINITKNMILTSSIKKLRFFQKVYFIKLFEKEATLIMSELVRTELNRLNRNMADGLTDKPFYYDLHRSFFGMPTIFPQSSSKVGTNDFYSGIAQAGDVPDVKNNIVTPPVQQTDKPQFVVEKYIRFEDRQGIQAPPSIVNRGAALIGAVSLQKAIQFIDINSNSVGNNYLSDFFGDLQFSYTSSFKDLMDKGFANPSSKALLISQNPSLILKISSAYKSYVALEDFEDFDVSHTSDFILEGEEKEPTGTFGSTGVKQGLRVSLVLPDSSNGGLDQQQIDSLRNNGEFVNLSLREKTFLFDDGTVVIPLVSAEVDFVDSKIRDFDIGSYDLECLINKMVEQDDFNVIFDKIFNLSMTSSMLAIYCMETMMPSIGRGTDERSESYLSDPDVEEWDGTLNVFVKNMLRKKFKSIYLSTNIDGLTPDEDDDSEFSFLKLSNPLHDLLDGINFNIPWWTRRRRVFKATDRNGEDCADPAKDLR